MITKMMGNRLREWMMDNRISGKELADHLELTAGAISSILAGRNKMSYETLARLLEIYPSLCPRRILLGETKDKEIRCGRFDNTELMDKEARDKIAMLENVIKHQSELIEFLKAAGNQG